MKNAKEHEQSLTSGRQMVLKKSHVKVRNLSKMDVCRFLVSFSLKYDVTDAILQDIEKMKVQYLRSPVFDLFETLQSVRT